MLINPIIATIKFSGLSNSQSHEGQGEYYGGSNSNLTNLTTTPVLSEDKLSNNKRPVRYKPPDNNKPPFNTNNLIDLEI